MLERPELKDEAILGALDAGYGLRARDLEFLPIGNDPASWAFAVHAIGGERYFLKVRAGSDGARGAVVPHMGDDHRPAGARLLPLRLGSAGPRLVCREHLPDAGRERCHPTCPLHGCVSTLAPRAIVDLALASIDSL
jgi:hypothetical protein